MDSAPTPTAAIATEGSETVPIDVNGDGDCKIGEVDENKDENAVDYVLPLPDSTIEACTIDM